MKQGIERIINLAFNANKNERKEIIQGVKDAEKMANKPLYLMLIILAGLIALIIVLLMNFA